MGHVGPASPRVDRARAGGRELARAPMQRRAKRSLLGPPLGTILFVALVPGTIVGLVPYRLSGWGLAPPLLGSPATRWIGVGLLLLGLPLFVTFLGRFVREGHGTPAPLAAPKGIGQGAPLLTQP